MALEIAALVRLAELDAALLGDRRGARMSDDTAKERRGLVAKLSGEVLEAYERALRAGRRPAVVRLAGSVCSGCFMRLHSKLDNQIRHRRGAAACPHCLRVVYDPGRLAI
jgi:predicted  nucleic acid-binding Zn-ribbon protein